jgi:hypothetical protein
MLNRRRFLAGVSGGFVIAASRSLPAVSVTASREEPQPLAAVDAFPFQLVVPALQQDGFFPEVNVSKLSAYQGGAVMVTAMNVLSGVASVFGRAYLLAPGPEGLAGIVGFGVVDPPGPAMLQVSLLDALGEPYKYAYEMTVLATQWTFDSIIIPPPPPPDPNAPPPPPPLPDEQPRLNAIYQGITDRRWRQGWLIPLNLGGDIFISGYFGEERSFNGGPRGGHHGGTDIAAPLGTEVHATNHGTVVLAERLLNRGNCVVVDHGAGIFSGYGHMDALRVLSGDVLTQGDVVGVVGSTGLSSGPHLHWEMVVGGIVVDGLRWLDGTQGFF